MNTKLLNNIFTNKCCNIAISKNSSYIYINDSGIIDQNNHRNLTEKAFDIGRKLNINKYLFDSTKFDYHDTFVLNCEYFYNTIFYLANISAAEKIALLVNCNKNSYSLISKLSKYYLDNFNVFISRKSAVEFLIQDTNPSPDKIKYPCSAIPKQSHIEMKINSIDCKCHLCSNTNFRFNPDINHIHPFKCMKCGADYSLDNFSYTINSKFDFTINR